MTEFVDGNRISLVRSGVEYFPELISQCDAARHEIHLETYIFEDDATGRAIAAALARAARRGVATHVMVDGFGSQDLDRSLVREMTEQLRHHVHDEETEQFPQLRERIPREELVRLREKVDTAKKLAPTRAHPSAPNTELFHKLAGPGVGMVDRLRDRLTNRSTG